MLTYDIVEARRLEIQNQLDAEKTPADRNKLGQFATPPALAIDMLAYAKSILPVDVPIRFFDPASGTGAFHAALLHAFPPSRIIEAAGYEIDHYYGSKALEIWGNELLKLRIADFTRAIPPGSQDEKPNLLICNPPYVRHHHLNSDEKLRLRRLAEKIAGVHLSELAGLYCYFLCISHAWMAEDCLAGWLIPSEFMDVNYGRQLKEYLLKNVTLLRIHRFDPTEVQFKDALVSSAVVWFRKAIPPRNHAVEFTYGGSLTEPKVSKSISVDMLSNTNKWTKFPLASVPESFKSNLKHFKLSDLFHIKRGLVTGANDFFILTEEELVKHHLPRDFFIPILPSPRYLATDEVQADSDGNPILEQRLFLLACDLPEDEVATKYPTLWKYLQIGVEKGINERYLCKHRSPWYMQEERPPSVLLCTYMGRQNTAQGRPFRFIMNHSKATAANVYLILYPKPILEKTLRSKPQLATSLWSALNRISPETLMGEGRVYGGGLHKLEPKELGNAPADAIIAVLPGVFTEQMKLF